MQEPNLDEYVIEGDFGEAPKDGFKMRLQRFLESKFFVALVIVLIGTASFFLGRLSGLEDKRVPVRVVSDASQNSNNPPSPPYIKGGTGEESVSSTGQTASVQNAVSPSNSQEKVVASKNGTKYHYPWCAGAKQISEKNLVTFNSIEEARAKGYTPAANCKGLK